jgi:hypothetical protein
MRELLPTKANSHADSLAPAFFPRRNLPSFSGMHPAMHHLLPDNIPIPIDPIPRLL